MLIYSQGRQCFSVKAESPERKQEKLKIWGSHLSTVQDWVAYIPMADLISAYFICEIFFLETCLSVYEFVSEYP